MKKNNITEKTFRRAYKPYDIVSDDKGNVGFVQEVSINDSQATFNSQIGYSVIWLKGEGEKNAWFSQEELSRHCNLFIKIAECSCHPFGQNEQCVEELFKNW